MNLMNLHIINQPASGKARVSATIELSLRKPKCIFEMKSPHTAPHASLLAILLVLIQIKIKLVIGLISHQFDVFNNANDVFGDVFEMEYDFDYDSLWEPVTNTRNPTPRLPQVLTNLDPASDRHHDFNALHYSVIIISAATSVMDENESENEIEHTNNYHQLITQLETTPQSLTLLAFNYLFDYSCCYEFYT